MFLVFSLLALAVLQGTAKALQSFDSWKHERIQLEDVSIHFRYSDSGKPPILI